MKKLLLLGIPILALAVALGLGYHFILDTDSAAQWYAQVDNAHVEPHQQDADEYEYSLEAFDEGGNVHEVSFKTERMLRDEAFLKLETMPVRGVISWEEVQPADIPPKAQEALGI